MQVRNFCRALPGLLLALAGAACGTADDPYSKFADPPLVRAVLHTVTLASDTDAIGGVLRQAGYTAAELPPNYPQADSVEASIWGVPEPVVVSAAHFKAAVPGKPDVRVLVMPLAAKGPAAASDVNESFFGNVLGTAVPEWPLTSAQPGNVRIQVWTYLVPNILEASKRLRGNGIPVVYDPVGITTSYLGDHRTLAIRSPDGTVVQLVEASAQ
jgi:hypothetical protein